MAAAALWLDEEELVRMTVQDVIDLRDGLPPEVVSALGKRLGDLDLEVRGEAARELAQAGALGSTPVAPLVVGLSSPLTWVRWACADSLWTLCRHARPALPALRRALGDPNDEVVECALGAIEEIGTDLGPEVVLALARLAVDPDSSNAYEAQNVLGDLGAEATVAVSFLLDALAEDQPYERRRRACLALTDIGPPAAEALPRLRGLAAEPQTRTYHLPYRARQAIESIEGAGAE